jgi:acyl-CoA synthetase (NDP forming)
VVFMIVRELLSPESIVVIGASNDPTKPGGRVLKNIIDGGYDGKLYALNPKETEVQGIECVKHPSELANVELAILAIASKYIPDTIELLAKEKGTKAFIVLSAGFSEIGGEGTVMEQKITDTVNSVGGSLIGPNCIGMLTPRYKGSFAGPIPKLDSKGIDFASGSGATACFILEAAIPMGLTFSSLYSVGNSAQIGVEDVLKHWDETYDPKTSSSVKMLYLEQIEDPKTFLKHSASLIRKGCRICAIKSGTTDAGSRAVSSHTGALAGSDKAVDALFRKAGIVRCYGKEELVYTAGIFLHKKLTGKNLAVITHAGGPGVMLTDTLSKGGLDVPHIEGTKADELLEKLFHGSSVANPIDFLATGTAEQLGIILDYCDSEFSNIDASVVIFGTPGLFDISPVYDLLDEKMKTCKKPIYPVLPSIVMAKDAVEHFISLGRTNFQDEVVLGDNLTKVFATPEPAADFVAPKIDTDVIRRIVDKADNGYLSPESVQCLLDAVKIPRAKEAVVASEEDAVAFAEDTGYPLVMKVVGPVHKTDVGGISLGVLSANEVKMEFERIMNIKDATGVLIQPMLSGTEIFLGAKLEDKYGHLILAGLGGIFVEALKDVAYGLSPLNIDESNAMIKSLRSYKLLEGVRGQEGVNIDEFAEIITKLSALLEAAPEIFEMDLNPLLGNSKQVVAVDARIRIEK